MKKSLPATMAVILMLATTFGSSSCGSSQKGYTGQVEPITVGMESTAVNSLIYIADSQRYFAANGIKITIKDDYPSGAAATDEMLKGEVDIATAAEFVIVSRALAKQGIKTLVSIDKFMHMRLIGRKDRGISGIADLKGKRIGVPLKTAAEFNLGRFLDLNNVDKNQVSIVDVQPPQAVDALMNGDVDAVVAWQPNVMTLKERLGDHAVIWSVHSKQPIYCAVIASSNWAKEHPELVERFLKSLAQAEDYLVKNPAEAKNIVQRRLGYGDEYIREIWPEHQFSLSLDESLITAMADEARWMIKNNLTPERQVPNFLDYIYEDGLKAEKPDVVNIIR